MAEIHKCTLVPARYFEEGDARCILSDLYPLTESETVSFVEIPAYDAVLVYVGQDSLQPVLYDLITSLERCSEYNKILFHFDGKAVVDIAIAQGGRLLLANSYPAADFTTAEYYLFLAVKSLQLNPEVSTVVSASALSPEEEMSLYRYFKAVEQL